ncbi:chromate transporter [Zwartia sp.]|uniref:chromate transporter n=1 Tax=Zwartia sp. TaxID=2978004 RepID=UPI00272806AD|nr:chromate transporter [Zwartia sp.]MDO9023446.1 chromate transporter [Zwartia sp.]
MTSPSTTQPKSLGELFNTFSMLAIQGFGGVLAFIERELVQKKKWMTREEFVEEWAIARTMPGPPALNLCIMVGARYFGWRGALVSLAGMFMFPTMIILTLAIAYAQFGNQPQVVDALRGMGAVAAGMIGATGIKLLSALKTNPLGVKVCAALAILSFVGIAILQWRLLYILIVLGGIGYVLAFIKLKDIKLKDRP